MRQGKLSIVIPLFCEAEHLETTIKTILGVIQDSNPAIITDWECVLVDDGSTDGTWTAITVLADEFPQRIKGLRFSRNFGKEAAIRAGLKAATGDVAVVMDGDLQHPPSLIPEMLALWSTHTMDVIHAVKVDRGKESLSYTVFVAAFNFLLKKATGQDLEGDSDYKLLDRKVIDAFLQLEERRMYFRGLVHWLGFRSATLPFEVQARVAGATKFNPVSLVRLALTAITSFSTAALHLVTALGAIVAFVAFILGGYTLLRWWIWGSVEGFTTVILLQLLIGGAVMIALGIMGEYLSTIYIEVKARPHYVVAEQVQRRESNQLHG